jgi:hypothetical protein
MRARQLREIIERRGKLFDHSGFAEHHLQVK